MESLEIVGNPKVKKKSFSNVFKVDLQIATRTMNFCWVVAGIGSAIREAEIWFGLKLGEIPGWIF